jgi:hypothetical protein
LPFSAANREPAMPLLHTVAHRLLRGSASRRLARVIPNPVARYAAVTAVTALLPLVMAALSKRRPGR